MRSAIHNIRFFSDRGKIEQTMNDDQSSRPAAGDINDYCRLCANVGDSMVPIYADEGADHGLEIKIKMHLPFLNIHVDDMLPKRICYHCASAVLVWNELFELSTVADSKLRNWFESSLANQRECKTVPYHVIGELNAEEAVEFEDISDINMFNKNDKSVNSLNDLRTVSNNLKSDKLDNLQLMLNEEPSDIQTIEKYPNFKRYMTESDEPLESFSAKEITLSKHYSCSFCTATFLKIRDKVKHERDIHGVQTNLLPIKYISDRYNDDVRFVDCEKNYTVRHYTSVSDLNEKDISNNCLCIMCNISFETEIEKQEHDQKLHCLQLVADRSPQVVCKSYGELFDEESDLDLIPQNQILNPEQYNNKCVGTDDTVESNNDSELFLNAEQEDEKQLDITDQSAGAQLDDDDDDDDDDLADNESRCCYCNEQFSDKDIASKHVCSSHVPNVKKPNQKTDEYDKYKVMIDNKLYYKCDQCTYAVEGRRYKFVYHMRVHTGEKPYACLICSKQFRTAAFLRRHVVCLHEKVRGYQCDICGRSFSEKRNVDDHRRTHTGERPFVCETCGKSFAQRSSMKIHWKQMHESIKSHKCEYCDKRFIRKCHLVAHLTHHTGVRNYVCAVCGKAFLRSGTLKGHTAVHSLERPFKCTICGDSFKLKKHLKQHGRVHSSESRLFVSQMEFIQTDNQQP